LVEIEDSKKIADAKSNAEMEILNRKIVDLSNEVD